jgi:hypothetical protein
MMDFFVTLLDRLRNLYILSITKGPFGSFISTVVYATIKTFTIRLHLESKEENRIEWRASPPMAAI